jgi:tetratricopeptide (TPR) repeat protein
MPDEVDELISRANHARWNNKLGEAKVMFEDVIGRLSHDSTDVRSVLVLRELAEVERRLGDRAAARAHYEEVIQQLRSRGDASRLAHAVRHLGDVHHELKQSNLANACYREALALYRVIPETQPLDLANAVRSMAILKQEMGATEEATVLWTEAQALYLATGVEAGVAESTRHLAELAG